MTFDFTVRDEGTLVLFTPESEAACEFAETAFAEAQMFGGAYVVEPRYAGPIVDDLVNHGFAVGV